MRTDPSDRYVLDIRDIDRTQTALAGGKGAHLGELSRIDGIRVPPGFCVTTDAFRRSVAGASAVDEALDRLAQARAHDRGAMGARSAELRRAVEAVAIPDGVSAAIVRAVAVLAGRGGTTACAVRSSATAEDSPAASFAGQHDTFLNVVGTAAILHHVRLCWASLFTERAVAYRWRNGIDDRAVHMAVVVQQMVMAQAAGVVFTADPVTSNRRVVSVEACSGLGDALVSGRVNGDVSTVRDGEVVATKVAEPHGQPVLRGEQVVELAELGRRIEAHFGCPQDIEWCLDGDGFQFVQSRPITTLFPVPAVDDAAIHVYISVGHPQMMTDPMKPLGLSLWQLTAMRPMEVAGGRLFVDVTQQLASPASRAGLLELMGRSDPLVRDAIEALVARPGFVPTVAEGAAARPLVAPGAQALLDPDPSVVAELVERTEVSLAALRRDIASVRGAALLDFIRADVAELKRLLFDPRSLAVIMTAMEATWWLNDHLDGWLGEKDAADTLAQSVPGNVTSEMGLALLDVADAIRPHPEVVAFLRAAEDDGFLERLSDLPGGPQARAAIQAFLDTYGMRCVGEIDVTRPRWSERPTTLVPVILGNVENFEPGARRRRFERGRQQAWDKEREVLQRLRALPDGQRKADEAKRMIDRVRTFVGYREYPKYGWVSRYFVYKQALLAEAERLVRAGVLRDEDDIFFLTFDELDDVVRTGRLDHRLVARRAAEFRSYHALTPPRVLTSDGECLSGSYRRSDVPAGALVGLPVSAGTVEGRARVVFDLADADLGPDDILVTAHTDPSWSPLFVAVKGLVTEVGGLMTHGAVIAREYGLPAVVGVEHATRLIRDGQRIRVHGSDGYVEVLSGGVLSGGVLSGGVLSEG